MYNFFNRIPRNTKSTRKSVNRTSYFIANEITKRFRIPHATQSNTKVFGRGERRECLREPSFLQMDARISFLGTWDAIARSEIPLAGKWSV